MLLALMRGRFVVKIYRTPDFGTQVVLNAGEVLWVSAGRGDIRGGFTHSHICEQGSGRPRRPLR
jgi:hypothetical protein